MSGRLDGKIALVTGGGSGIGAAIVQRFAAAGAKVALTGRRIDPLNQVAARVDGLALQADVRDAGQMARVVEQVLQRWRRLDIVVANAGVISEGDAAGLKPDQWQASLDINLTGVMQTLRATLPALAACEHSAVVIVSSVAGLLGVAQSAAYCAAKAGVIGLTRATAVDFGPRGVRVNALCPGWARTPMSDAEMAALAAEKGMTVEEAVHAVTKHLPLQRMADAQEIAACAEFLASDDASFVTGAVLVADGGGCAVDVGTLAFASDK